METKQNTGGRQAEWVGRGDDGEVGMDVSMEKETDCAGCSVFVYCVHRYVPGKPTTR